MRDILGKIHEKLLEIEQKENVTILLAVESGSRAWGFASPDSDYDVRFIYARRPKDYLKLKEEKDVIEWQLDDVLDINGWDLKKALAQFHRSNATLFEWSNSPVVYKKTKLWEEIYGRAGIYFSKKAAVYHYYGTAQSTFQNYLQEEQVRYKKYFYALRPLLACRYVEANGTAPPVLFDDLLQMELPESLRRGIEELLEIKKATDEKERKPQMPVIIEFIREELKRQKQIADAMEDDRRGEWDTLDEIYRKQILFAE